MNCEQARMLLLERLNEGAAAPIPQEVERHLAGCEACSREAAWLSAEERLVSRYRNSRLEGLRIPSGAWERIEAAGRNRVRGVGSWIGIHGRFERQWLRQLAFAAALVVATAGLTLLAVRNFAPDSTTPVAERAGSGTLDEALQAIDLAERQYQEAIRVLGKAVEKRKHNLDPTLVAELEKNLKAVDAGIEAARRAYREHRADTELAYYMLSAYRKKVEILQEIVLS